MRVSGLFRRIWATVHRYIKRPILPYVHLALLTTGCTSAPARLQTLDPVATYEAMLDRLDQDHLGQGLDIFNDSIKDQSMAYALILRAEANRYHHGGALDALERTRRCGQWLLDNADRDGDAIMGFGLADAWDAFQDSTINPADHEYTITTSLCVEALLDWYAIEARDTLLQQEIHQVVQGCLAPYVGTTWDSPVGIPSYSLSASDRAYDVFNPGIHLAGQLQRVSRHDLPGNNAYARKAASIMEAAAAYALPSPSGSTYWNYGVQRPSANDLVHASYIAEGIRAYLHHGGSTTIPWDKVVAHFDDFGKNDLWYEHPRPAAQDDAYHTRLWALAQLLYSMALEGRDVEIERTLWPQLCQYQGGRGFKLRRADERILVRHEAHLLLGLSYWLFRPGVPKTSGARDTTASTR